MANAVCTAFSAVAAVLTLYGCMLHQRANSWRTELTNGDDMTTYGPPTTVTLQHQCRVTTTHAPVDGAATTLPQSAAASPPLVGLHMLPDAVSSEHVGVLLSEVRRLVQQYGNRPARKMAFASSPHTRDALHTDNNKDSGGDDVDEDDGVRIVADHAVDTQAVRTPWGSGDRLRVDVLPASLRHLVAQLQGEGAQQQTDGGEAASLPDSHFRHLGRLRHVYVLYAPHNRLQRSPATPSWFDGHDYVMVPLRRDMADTVVTMVPLLRSRHASLEDVAARSWTSHDVDVRVPCGAAVRVYGKARYLYGWALRPSLVPWFGSPSQHVLPPSLPSASALSTMTAAAAAGASLSSSSMSRMWRLLSLRRCDERATAMATTACADTSSEVAMLVLHFEGPYRARRQRSPGRQPEWLVYGRMPTPASFAAWSRPWSVGDDDGDKSLRVIARHVIAAFREYYL